MSKVKVRKATSKERDRFGITAWQNGKRGKNPAKAQEEAEEEWRLMNLWARNGFVSGYGIL